MTVHTDKSSVVVDTETRRVAFIEIEECRKYLIQCNTSMLLHDRPYIYGDSPARGARGKILALFCVFFEIYRDNPI